MIKVTIFTSTYNREKYLYRLYESIKGQNHLDEIEWIVIDDGSTDNTQKLMKRIQKVNNNEFLIYYKKVEHGGKHRAINKALDIARGDYFFIVDSDDYLEIGALDNVMCWISELGEEKTICAVSGLRVFSNGVEVGRETKFDKECFVDVSIFDRHKFGLDGDKAEVYKTSLMKQHKFPEFDNEFFVTEDVCWNAIAAEGYKVRWYNVPIYVCDYLEDGLTKSGANRYEGHKENFNGYRFYIEQCMRIIPLRNRMAYFTEYDQTTKKMGIPLKTRAFLIKQSIVNYRCLKILSLLYRLLKKVRNNG